MILAENSGSNSGATYSFTDRGLPPGAYTYVLRVIKLDGTVEQLEPKVVTVKP